jgi:hypothetical protein
LSGRKKPGDVPGFSAFVVCCILTSSDRWFKNLDFNFYFNSIMSRINGNAMRTSSAIFAAASRASSRDMHVTRRRAPIFCAPSSY